MAEIRLQDYTAKIKEHIRHDRLDEAIAHCQHILRHYPRHIETYYLLGEACLDKRMVREAIEFFQRTLSADPENFFARVGLGIVYDEQGALLEAIWQMERAFELMPGNNEVRRELQRLYAQRDGVEKTRLKLTRGALGRLYSRNGLYEQAIGEFHAILRQDPELPDIQLALIEALWREGRRVEAVEGCLDLLEALPNCLKANLILGTIWTQGGHEDAGLEKLEVARALDPENRMAQELFGSDSPLPPEEVCLEELVPAAELGLVPADEGRAVVPWGVEGEERALEVQEEAEPGEEIPDWLRDVGLVAEGEGEEEGEAPPPQVAAAEPAPGEAMPPWLQELMGEQAQAGPLPEAAVQEEDRDDQPPLPDWLEELKSAEPGESSPPSGIELPAGAAALTAESAAGEQEPAALPQEEEAGLPDWLQELGVPRRSVPLAGEGLPDEEELEELPDWLQELRPDREELAPPVPAAEAEGVAGPEEEPELPALEPEAVAAGPVAEEAEEVPPWLRDLGLEAEGQEIEAQAEVELPAVEAQAPEGEAAPPAGEEVPDWLLALGVVETRAEAEEVIDEQQGLLQELEEEGAPAAAVRFEEEAEAPAWLQEPVVPEAEEVVEAPTAEGRVEPGAPAGEIPESLRALVEAGILAEEDLAEAMAQMSPEELEAQQAEAVPEWLQDLLGEGEAEVRAPAVEEVIEEPAAEEVPAWLEEPVVPEAEAPAAEVEEPEGPAAEVPAWLEEPVVPEAEAPAAELEEPEGPAAEVPAWLQEPVVPEAEAPAAEVEEPEGTAAEEVPAWLEDLGVPEAGVPAAELEEPEAPAAEEVPAWLQEPVVPEAEEVVEAPTAEGRVEPGAPAGEIPESLRALVEAGILAEEDLAEAMAQMSPEELEAQQAEAVPEWLQDLLGEGEAEVRAPAVEEVIEEPAAEVPAWLEDLGVPEAEAPAAEVEEPGGPEAEAPAWLQEPVVPEAEAPAAELEEPEGPAAEVPAWLQEPVVPEVEAPEPEAEEPAVAEMTEWLESLGRREAEIPAKEAVEEPPAEALAWLEEPGVPEVEVPAAEVEEPESPPAEELPAWPEARAEPVAEAPEAEEPAVAEMTGWLESLGRREAQAPTVEPEAAPAADEVSARLEAPAEPVAEEPAPTPEETVAAPPAEEIRPPAPEPAPHVPLAEAAPAPVEEPAAVEEPPSAERRYQELREELQARPRNHPLRLEMARMCAAQKEWKSALGHYEKLIAARKMLPDVLQDLQRLLDEDVERARVYQLLGDVYMQEDQLDRALEMYRQSRRALLKH